MTYSYTQTQTFTLTDAVYLASKVAADLKQMQLFYGEPSDEEITDYAVELGVLLVNRCVKMVEYGFRKANNWVVVVRYDIRSDGLALSDDRSGRIPAGVEVTGASWYSFLQRSETWWSMDQSKRDRIEDSNPVKRTPGVEPDFGSGGWSSGKSYSRNGTMLERGVYLSR